MRSRRNVKNTKRRSRNRKMTRRVKTKRGGMRSQAAAAARSKLGTTYYHDVLPSFTQFKTTFGKNPTPEQKEVVLKGERYFRSGADFPVDDAIKASITELKKEFSSTEKNAEKALDIYNKILKTLEDAKKRQKDTHTYTPGQPAHETFSSRSMYANSPSSLFVQGMSYGLQSSSPFAHTPQKLTRPHFNTPSKPNSTELTAPPVLSGSEKEAQSITDNDDLIIQGKQLFPNDENSTPINSPFKSPPRLSSKPKSALRSPFSPSRPRLNLPD